MFKRQLSVIWFHKYNFDKLQFLTFLQARVRELKKDDRAHAITFMLVGIPNVGKSALANSLHQVGRISAAGAISLSHLLLNWISTLLYQTLVKICDFHWFEEKGRLKHSSVTPQPGETKSISSLKVHLLSRYIFMLFPLTYSTQFTSHFLKPTPSKKWNIILWTEEVFCW